MFTNKNASLPRREVIFQKVERRQRPVRQAWPTSKGSVMFPYVQHEAMGPACTRKALRPPAGDTPRTTDTSDPA